MAKPLKVGLIGTGAISRAHLPVYEQFPEKVKLTAVCDIIEEAAQERARDANVDAIYTDYEKMLQEADIDAVDICTGHDTHAPIVIAAAEAGKHALVEKPMGNSMQECRDMIAAADKAGVTLMIAHMLRFSPSTQAVRQLLQDGEIGTIRAARIDIMMNAVGTLREGHWMLDGNAGGGIGMTNTIHEVDLVRHLVGDVKRVNGVSRTVSPRLKNGAEDILCARLSLKMGAVGTVLCLWCAARGPVSQQYTLFGDKGALHSCRSSRYIAATTSAPSWSRRRADEPGTEPVNRRAPGGRKLRGWKTSWATSSRLRLATGGYPATTASPTRFSTSPSASQEGKEPISSGRDILGSMKVLFWNL